MILLGCMFRKLTVALMGVVCCGLVISHPVLADAIPIEQFYTGYEFTKPSLSPDGKSVAVLHNHNGAKNLKVLDLETYEVTWITNYEASRVNWYTWLDNNQLAFSVVDSKGRPRLDDMFNVASRDGRRMRRLSTQEAGRHLLQARFRAITWLTFELLDAMPDDPNHVLITTWNIKLNRRLLKLDSIPTNETIFSDVYRMNVNNGRMTRIVKNPGGVYQWLVDHEHNVRVGVTRENDLSTRILHREGKQWTEVMRFGHDEESVWPLEFSRDGKSLFVLSNIGRDTLALGLFDIQRGRLIQTLFAHPDVDVSGLVYSKSAQRLVAAIYTTDQTYYRYFIPQRARLERSVSRLFNGYATNITFNDDGSSALVVAANDKNPGRYYHYDADKKELRELFRVNEALPEDQLSSTRSISVKARDDVVLQGYLTVPENKKPNGAMLIMVHGGPHSVRNYWGFNPDVQFLVSRGYSVLQLNFRGSWGFGRKFERSGWYEWNAAIQDDIADAAMWAIQEGLAKEDKVCLFGASFGGYSAIMSLAKYPDLYSCAISFAGVSDLPKLYNQAQAENDMIRQWLDTVVGAGSVSNLENASPLNYVSDIESPVLIAHGMRDSVVSVEQTRELEAELSRLGKQYLSIYYRDENHQLESVENRIDFFNRVAAFLQERLFGPPPAVCWCLTTLSAH